MYESKIEMKYMELSSNLFYFYSYTHILYIDAVNLKAYFNMQRGRINVFMFMYTLAN